MTITIDPVKKAAIVSAENRKSALSSDAGYIDLLNRAKTATPQQIDNWLTSNVTNLAQARSVLAAIIKIVAVKLT